VYSECFLHLTRFPVTAARIFLTSNVVSRAHQRFHAGRFVYIPRKKIVGVAKNFFTVYDKTQPERILRGAIKKKREKKHTFFFNRLVTFATRGTSASKREATGYHTPRSLRNALSAAIRTTANRLRRSVRARLLSFCRRNSTRCKTWHSRERKKRRLHRFPVGSKRRHAR